MQRFLGLDADSGIAHLLRLFVYHLYYAFVLVNSLTQFNSTDSVFGLPNHLKHWPPPVIYWDMMMVLGWFLVCLIALWSLCFRQFKPNLVRKLLSFESNLVVFRKYDSPIRELGLIATIWYSMMAVYVLAIIGDELRFMDLVAAVNLVLLGYSAVSIIASSSLFVFEKCRFYMNELESIKNAAIPIEQKVRKLDFFYQDMASFNAYSKGIFRCLYLVGLPCLAVSSEAFLGEGTEISFSKCTAGCVAIVITSPVIICFFFAGKLSVKLITAKGALRTQLVTELLKLYRGNLRLTFMEKFKMGHLITMHHKSWPLGLTIGDTSVVTMAYFLKVVILLLRYIISCMKLVKR